MLKYKTVESPKAFEIPKIKWSRFIGHILPVSTKEEAEAELKKLQNFHHQATHNCPAYRVGIKAQKDLFGVRTIEPERIYASDDGEPSGTAAYPMKNTLAWEGLENVLVVITRYFGGTLLWVGGLVKAYTEATKAVIEKAKVIEKEVLEEVCLQLEQTQVPEFLKTCSQQKIKILEQNYGNMADFRVAVNVATSEEFKKVGLMVIFGVYFNSNFWGMISLFI